MLLKVTVTMALYVCLAACPAYYTYNNGSDTCLILMRMRLDWSTSSDICYMTGEKAHLVVMQNATKQTAVANFIQGQHITIVTSDV